MEEALEKVRVNGVKSKGEGFKGDGGVGGCGVHLSPWIHEEYTFRHRSACRIPAGSR